MNRWYRAYEGTAEDGKIRLAARHAGVTVATLLGTWHGLLEDASHSEPRGTPTRGAPFWCAVLDVDTPTMVAMLDGMEKAGLIATTADGGIAVTRWKERQFETDVKDPTAAERKRRERELHGPRTKRHGRVTVASRPDTESQTEPEKKNTPVPPQPTDAPDDKPKPAPGKKRAGGKKAKPEAKGQAKITAADLNEAERYFNEVAQRVGWPVIRGQFITGKRLDALRARLLQHGMAVWKEVVDRAASSDFLTGKVAKTDEHKNWKFTFDNVIGETSFNKIASGNFDNQPEGKNGAGIGRNGRARPDTAAEGFLGAVADFARSGDGVGGRPAEADAGLQDQPGGGAGDTGKVLDLDPAAFKRAV